MSSSGRPREDRRGDEDYDRIEPAELAAALAAWDLPDLQDAEPFDRGSRRAPKLRLRTAGGELLLKRRQPEQAGPRRVAFAHAALAHLAARGVPVAAPIPDRRGRTAVRRPAGCYELFPFLPGRRPRPDARSAEAAGGMLARVHEAGADFAPPGPAEAGSWHAVADLPRTLEAVPRRVHRLDPGTDESDLARCCRFLTRAYELASERAAEAMAGPAGLVHGDWHPGNLLAHGGRLTAVLDFDAARLEPRITDVANACLQFAVDRPSDDPRQWPGVLAYERIRAVITGYERIAGPLPPADRAALPWLMIEALVIESVVPIAREGRFGRFPASAFLPMVERKVRWLHERAERLVDYLARPAE
ncbi:MAG: phosphotransferase enzyme family protein [Planctomycetota bacterium]